MNPLKNPEIRRNAWLQCSLASLIAVPIVLLILVLITAKQISKGVDYLPMLGLIGFALSTTVLGARRVFASVIDEVAARTWDAQRMSAMSAGEMMLGKLLGAPLFLWFVGGCCLLVTIVSALYLSNLAAVIKPMVLLVLVTLQLHAICLALGTAVAGAQFKMNSAAKWGMRIAIIFLIALPVILLVSTLALLQGLVGAYAFSSKNFGSLNTKIIEWWGSITLGALDFAILSAAMLCLWALYVAFLAMAKQLKSPHRWWIWLLFPLFAGLWFGGIAQLIPEINRPALGFLIASLITSLVGLPLLLINPLTRQHLARLDAASESKKTVFQLLALLPAWVPAVFLALGTTALALLCLGERDHSFLWLSEAEFDKHAPGYTVLIPMTLLSGIQFLSNALLLCTFTLNRRVKNPIAWAIFSWFALFWLLSTLFRVLGLNGLANFLSPMEVSFFTGFFYISIHCVVFFAAAVWAAKQRARP